MLQEEQFHFQKEEEEKMAASWQCVAKVDSLWLNLRERERERQRERERGRERRRKLPLNAFRKLLCYVCG